MSLLAGVVSGRVTKWVLIVAWVVLTVVLERPGSKLADVSTSATESFLPSDAQSTRVVRLLDDRFASGETATGLVVYQRTGGLTAADRRKIARDAEAATSLHSLPVVGRPAVPFQPGSPPGLVSSHGDLAFTAITVRNDNKKLGDWGKDLRNITGSGSAGLRVFVTGDLGLAADDDEASGATDTRLLIATVALVLVLLSVIYRSPLIALLPLLVVGTSFAMALGLIYLYAKSGATVATNSTNIVVVLMFGVGTDYCLLLVSRYREELRRVQDKHEAMRMAVRRAGPAILASGLTVAAAMLVLLVADIGSTQTFGPVAAIGVTLVCVAALTVLPALLTVFGRRGFWPRQGQVAYRPGAPAPTGQGVWRRVGGRVLQRPATALGLTVALFALGGLGILAYKEDYSVQGAFKTSTEGTDGFLALERAFPAGVLSPTTVLVRRTDGPVRAADVAAVRRRLTEVPQVASVSHQLERSRDGRIASLQVVFRDDPLKAPALARVPTMRQRLSGLPPGVEALTGQGSAIYYDFKQAAARDLKLIVPLVLIVLVLILAALLEALVAPLLLIATVLVSFLGTFGLSLLFFRYVLGDAGVIVSLPTFAFIFLVALGIDYTIFLMSRVREEARRHGTREGVLLALSATGPVITSAGLVLAGTFSVLMTIGETLVFDIGFMVALGILLDTFVVRTIMVPALIELVGDRIWWPSSAAGGAHALREPAARPAPGERSQAGGRGGVPGP